mgnify:CR=1 FL=1
MFDNVRDFSSASGEVKKFKPDIIFIDYLNICASSRFKGAQNINSYMYIKAIAEELRGLACEANVPIISATQTTRSGFGSSDVELTEYPVAELTKDQIVDTNGAGDAFVGGFLSELYQGKDIKTCIYAGIYLSREVVQKSGGLAAATEVGGLQEESHAQWHRQN